MTVGDARQTTFDARGMLDFKVQSALDARRLGFEVTEIEAGCRGIDAGGSWAAAWIQMKEAGVIRA